MVPIERCTQCRMLLFDDQQQHECGAHSLPKSYRLNPMASPTSTVFKLRVSSGLNGAEVTYFDKRSGKFLEFLESTYLQSAATSGCLTLSQKDEFTYLTYESTRKVSFKFFVAMMTYQNVSITLGGNVTADGVFFENCTAQLVQHEGKWKLPDEMKMSTGFIIALKPKSRNIQVQLRCNDETKAATWTYQNGWDKIDTIHSNFNALPNQNQNQNQTAICYNCNQNHETTNCDRPYYIKHYVGCLVVSLDGSEHEKPCMPINKIMPIRDDILAANTYNVFHLICSKSNGQLYYLHEADGVFKKISERVKLTSSPAEMLITFKETQDSQCIVFQQTIFKRCSVLLAIFDPYSKVWRRRLMLVPTDSHSLVAFKQLGYISTKNQKLKNTL